MLWGGRDELYGEVEAGAVRALSLDPYGRGRPREARAGEGIWAQYRRFVAALVIVN